MYKNNLESQKKQLILIQKHLWEAHIKTFHNKKKSPHGFDKKDSEYF